MGSLKDHGPRGSLTSQHVSLSPCLLSWQLPLSLYVCEVSEIQKSGFAEKRAPSPYCRKFTGKPHSENKSYILAQGTWHPIPTPETQGNVMGKGKGGRFAWRLRGFQDFQKGKHVQTKRAVVLNTKGSIEIMNFII